MTLQVADSLLAEALARPLMITEDGFSTILAVLSRTNLSTPDAIALREGEKVRRSSQMEVRADGTAVIPVVGPIVRRADLFSKISGATDLAGFRDDLVAALDARSVSRILLMFDTPGGEVTGIAEMAAYIRKADATKPIVAYAEGMMASAGYYLASAAREVVASPQAVVGSIGVRMAVRGKERGDTSFEFVSSQSPKKNLDPATPDGRAGYLQLMDDLAAVFIRDVAKYRGVSEETVLSDYGQGWVYAADRALESGLIDRIETQDEVLERLSASVPTSPAERAGTTRRTTAVASPAIAPEEHMKHTHRAPEAGAGAGGGGSEAGAPSTQANDAAVAAAVTAAVNADRERIAAVLEISQAIVGETVLTAITSGTSVASFALARARAEKDADKIGAAAHLEATRKAEAAAKDAKIEVPAADADDADESAPTAAAARILANARAAGVSVKEG
jgi:capsid assembly protease